MNYFILLVILKLGLQLEVFTDKQIISLAIGGFILLIVDALRGK